MFACAKLACSPALVRSPAGPRARGRPAGPERPRCGMGHVPAARTAPSGQLCPLLTLSLFLFPSHPGAPGSPPESQGGQPRPSCQAPRGVGQAAHARSAPPLPPPPGRAGGRVGAEAGKPGGQSGRRGLGRPPRSPGPACRSNALLQREGLRLAPRGWRKVAEPPNLFLPASRMPFPSPFWRRSGK